MKSLFLVGFVFSAFAQAIWAAAPNSVDPICGAEQIRLRWQFSPPSGWLLKVEAGAAVDGNILLPPGKKVTDSDRALAIAAFPKAEERISFSDFVQRTIRNYQSLYPGGPPPKITLVDTGKDGSQLQLYSVKPGPRLPIRPTENTYAFMEDESCFIAIYLSTRYGAKHESNIPDLVTLVRSLKKQ